MAKNKKKVNPEQVPAGVAPDLEPAVSTPASTELTFQEALEAAGKPDARITAEVPAPTAETAPLKEVKEIPQSHSGQGPGSPEAGQPH
jgi:hypothetical protein